MGRTIMWAVVSLDGYIADDNDEVGPLFDWYGNGDVEWKWTENDEHPLRTTQASADFVQEVYPAIGAVVMGRRLFDQTDGWDGVPAAGDHVFVVTHTPPTDWKHEGTAPFTFVTDGVEAAITQAKEYCGPDRIVDVAAGQIGGQALRLGLIDQVVMNVVPVVFGAGRPFFGAMGPGDSVTLANPSRVVQGDRVTHLLYDVVGTTPRKPRGEDEDVA
jgi:dihydrofolate reductase